MRHQGVTNLAAAASNANVLSGSMVEFVERPSRVRFFIVGDAAGEGRASVQIGTRGVMNESPLNRAARFPLVPDDLTCEDVALPGQRITLALRNTGAGANNTFWAVEVLPIA